MEGADAGGDGVAHGAQLILSSGAVVGEGQQLVLSAEDAAQLLAQAGIQLGDNEQVIIGDASVASAVNGGEDVVASAAEVAVAAEEQQVADLTSCSC